MYLPGEEMKGMREHADSVDTASLSSSEEYMYSMQSSNLRNLSEGIGENDRHPPPRCHPIAFEINLKTLKKSSRRPSLLRQLYENLRSEELKVENEDAEELIVENEDENIAKCRMTSRSAADFKFTLSKASGGDSRVSTERHHNGLGGLLLADSVDDQDDSEIEQSFFGYRTQ